MCDFEEERPDDGFDERFRKFQNLIHFTSPYMSLGSKKGFTDDQTCKSITRKKTQGGGKCRTKITPLIKERESPSQEARVHVIRERAEADECVSERFRGKLAELADVITSSRSFISADTITSYAEKFISDYGVKIPKGKDKGSLTLLYCIIMSCRLNGIFMDLHLLAIDLEISLKDIVTTINESLPPITTTDPIQRKLLSIIITSPRTLLSVEFSERMIQTVRDFPGEKKLEVADTDVKRYEENCRGLFAMLENDISSDHDRQFCVTPDKIYIYGMFDMIREKAGQVTERVISDYLSSRFMTPRVTVEKMKRLVVKCRASQC
jgi:hypothetical protein